VIKAIRMRRAGYVARTGKRTGAYEVLVGKPEGERPRRRWEDNIKTYLQEMGLGDTDWIDLAQNTGRR